MQLTCFECNKNRVIAQRIASDMVEKSNKIAELEMEIQRRDGKIRDLQERLTHQEVKNYKLKQELNTLQNTCKKYKPYIRLRRMLKKLMVIVK